MSILSTPSQDTRAHHPTVRNDRALAGGASQLATPATCCCQLSDEAPTLLERALRSRVEMQLGRISAGQLHIVEKGRFRTYGTDSCDGLSVTLHVLRGRFWRRVALGGSLAAAEAYLDGDIASDNLTAVLRVLARNANGSVNVDSFVPRLTRWRDTLLHWLRPNTTSGSRRNIRAHYDLSNEFFAQFLDPTMTYSCGVFEQPDSTMEQASLAKYERICQKLRLQPSDRVLEIGCGWGGFARYAALNYGCHVTATTISQQQFEHAQRSIAEAGLADRVTVLQHDYRALDGQYDKLVSIEMVEAVGERYLPTFFRTCCQLLSPDGLMLLQAITIPDHRYDRYRRSVDFIQKYVFPGGFLPCPAAIGDCLRRKTDFRLFDWEELGPHYAKTLRHWRRAFDEKLDEVCSLGFDERFVRLWRYYLSYCEAGFEERQIGVAQVVLTRPDCRVPDFILAPFERSPNAIPVV